MTARPRPRVWIIGLATLSAVALVFRPGDDIVVSSENGAHFMLFGGASLGSKRYIWWNFVSSSKERIEQAKQEWKTGRFDIVPGDEEEFIPLPEG